MEITIPKKSLALFFFLIIIFSLPLFFLGNIIDLTKIIPINLPLSALMFICPITVALILTYKKQGLNGVRKLLNRIFDYKNIKNKVWYLPLLLLMPVILTLSYIFMLFMKFPLPEPNISVLVLIIFIIIFFVGAIGEEVGWTGYALDPLQAKYGALKASLIIGLFWAIWHAVPFTQTHHSFIWIFWQGLNTVALRVIMVGLYNNSGKSVFGVILFHMTINVSEFLFPNYGSHYDPAISGIIIICVAIASAFFLPRKLLLG